MVLGENEGLVKREGEETGIPERRRWKAVGQRLRKRDLSRVPNSSGKGTLGSKAAMAARKRLKSNCGCVCPPPLLRVHSLG